MSGVLSLHGVIVSVADNQRTLKAPSPVTAAVSGRDAGPQTEGLARVATLDGLRGVAAAVVVLCHIIEISPAFSGPRAGTLTWCLSYMPTNLLWNGEEAVIVFFVLSGFVLTRPFTRAQRNWRIYYPRRLLRLYPPIWGALILTIGMSALEHRHGIPGATYYLDHHSNTNLNSVEKDALLPSTTETFDVPLWSLHWEIIFSLLLPAYVLVGKYFKISRPTRWVVAAGILVLAGVDAKSNSLALSDAILYLPMFGAGALMAFYEADLVRIFRSILSSSSHVRIALIVLVLALADASQYASTAKSDLPGWFATFTHGLDVIGAAGLILIVLSWRRIAPAFDSRPIQWLGKRSFSLYLIHEPILITYALWVGGHPNPAVTVALIFPTVLVATGIFYVLVELPSHRFANAVGRRIAELSRPRPAVGAV